MASVILVRKDFVLSGLSETQINAISRSLHFLGTLFVSQKDILGFELPNCIIGPQKGSMKDYQMLGEKLGFA